MGNDISYAARPDLPDVQMNNGLTSVVISALALAASALADDDRGRSWAVWIAARDQGTFGLGMIGFDLSDLPWQAATFATDRGFLLRVIDAAANKTGWQTLDYTPREDWVLDALARLRGLVEAFVFADASPSDPDGAPLGGKPERFERCPTHGVYLHIAGCVVCNDS